jgi:spore maturation protein CgeB
MKHYRILFEGNRWFGSNALSAYRALRRLGHLVSEVDYSTVVPEFWTRLELRALRRIIMPQCLNDHNQNLLKMAREFKPHLFIAFKGAYILPRTLVNMRHMGIALFNYYPDVSAFSHRYSHLPESLPLYDCVFSTKSFLQDDLRAKGIELRRCEILPHGYDPELMTPSALDPEESRWYAADVVFIGIWSPEKEETLASVRRLIPGLDLAIWGNQWDKAHSPELRGCIRGRGVLGDEYVQALCGSKIALGLLSEKVIGASQGDAVTSRTFNIPPTRTMMIHKRTEEVLRFYEEDKELVCYSSAEELAEKIAYYLAHPEERAAITQAAYDRCVPAYGMDTRMQEIMDFYEQNFGAGPAPGEKVSDVTD